MLSDLPSKGERILVEMRDGSLVIGRVDGHAFLGSGRALVVRPDSDRGLIHFLPHEGIVRIERENQSR